MAPGQPVFKNKAALNEPAKQISASCGGCPHRRRAEHQHLEFTARTPAGRAALPIGQTRRNRE